MVTFKKDFKVGRLTVRVERDNVTVITFTHFRILAQRMAILSWVRDQDGKRRVRFSVWDLTTYDEPLLFKLGSVNSYAQFSPRAPQVRFPRFVQRMVREIRHAF